MHENGVVTASGGDQKQGKIALYSAGKTPDGHPVVLVDITGTEFDFSGQHSNLPTNWGASGSGAPTDLEAETVGAIQDAYKRGDIPKDAVIDLTGHSLGAIVANNISGRPDAEGHAGKIDATGPDGAKAELPIRNEIGNSLDSVFKTYLQGDRFKDASPAEKKAIVSQDEARLRDVVKKIAKPLADEVLRQKIMDMWGKIHLPF